MGKAASVVLFLVGVALFFLAKSALATPGGVDANGCHKSKDAGIHCHPERATNKALPGGETHAQRDKRLARECKNSRDGGACLGYGKKP